MATNTTTATMATTPSHYDSLCARAATINSMLCMICYLEKLCPSSQWTSHPMEPHHVQAKALAEKSAFALPLC